MTKEEALKKRPCCKCKHCKRCEIVDFIYSPCNIQTDYNYHPGFEAKEEMEEEND